MAQETEVVVFEVDVSSYEKSLADLTKSINGLKDTQADLQKQTKDGAKGAAESLEKVNAQLKLQQQEYRTTQNILVGYTGAQQKNVNTLDFAKNSIQANRDLLKQLTAQYINTAKPTQDFTNQIKKLSDELKKQEGAIGDTRRNVGNYFDTFTKGVPQLGAAVDGVKGLGVAFKGAGGGVAGLAAGFATLGLPLIIAGVTALIDVFKDFEPVAEAIENAVAGIKAGFAALISGNDIGKAVEQSQQLLQVTRDLEDTQKAFNLQQEKSKNLIQQYIIASKDRTKSDEDRIELIKKANDLEESIFNESVSRLDKDLNKQKEIFKEKNSLSEGQYRLLVEGTSQAALNLRNRLENTTSYNKKELESIQDLELKKEQISGDSLALQEKLANNENKIREELKAEKDKELADEIKRAAELEAIEKKKIAELENGAKEFYRLKKQRIELLEIGEKKETDLFIAGIEERTAKLIEDGFTAQEIEEVKQRGLNEIRAKYAAKEVEIDDDKYLKLAEAQDKANQEAKDKAIAAQLDTAKAITQIVTETVNAISGLLSAVSSLIQQTAQQNIQSLQEQAGDGAAEQKRVAIESRAIKLKAWKQAKAINITMAVMNTATAVMSQLSNPTPYVGFVLAALAAATGAIQIAMIAKQKPPSFALGGKVVSIGGKSHSEGGTPIHVGGQHVAEAEAGEGLFVMKKDAYNDIQMLSGWNQRYGGRSFTGSKTRHAADGGEIQIPSDGGFSTRSIRSATDNAMQVEMAIMNGFKKAPAPELSIVELNSKQTSRNRSVDVVSL